MGEFTRNWTSKYEPYWREHLVPEAGRPLVMLEIGVFEGRSSRWFLENVLVHPASRHIGVDPWILEPMCPRKFPRNVEGQEKIAAVERRARETLAPFGAKSLLLKGLSQDVLPGPLASVSLDIAYIDGDHRYAGCLADTRLVWPLVKPGGIVIWDDVNMARRGPGKRDVRRAVDEFLDGNEGWQLLYECQQLAVRKHA